MTVNFAPKKLGIYRARSCKLHCAVDLNAIMRSMEDFSGIDERTFEEILNIAHIKEYPKDSIIFYKDDIAQTLQYLFHGAIKSYKINKYDNEAINNLFVNDCAKSHNPPLINYDSLIDGKSRNNLYCLEPCRVLIIQIEPFRELLKSDIILANNMLLRSHKIIDEMDYLLNLAVMDSKTKIITLLERNPDILSNVSKKLIASLLNISQETLSRTLQEINAS